MNGHTLTYEERSSECGAYLDKLDTPESERVGIGTHQILIKPLKLPGRDLEVVGGTMGKTHGMILTSNLFLLEYNMATLTRG